MNRVLNLIGRVIRNLRRHGVTTSDVTDEDIIDELNQGQNQIISEINTEKSAFITLADGIDSYLLSTGDEPVTETTMEYPQTLDLIGTKNGVNQVFTFPMMPKEGAELVFLNGVKLTRDVDYEIAYNSVTAVITMLTYTIVSTDRLEAHFFED